MQYVQGTLILATIGLIYGPMSSVSNTLPQKALHTAQAKMQEAKMQEMDLRDVVKLSKVSLLDAMKAAAQVQTGTIVEAGLEGEVTGKKREVFFEIMILDKKGSLHEVKIHPGSAAVLDNGTEEDQEEAKEFQTALRHTELDLGQLIQKASTIIKGQPVSAALKMEEDGAECEIVFVNSRYLIEASMETRAGHLVDLELRKDGDEESEENAEENDHEEGNRRGGSQVDEDDEGEEQEEEKGEEQDEEEEDERNEKGRGGKREHN